MKGASKGGEAFSVKLPLREGSWILSGTCLLEKPTLVLRAEGCKSQAETSTGFGGGLSREGPEALQRAWSLTKLNRKRKKMQASAQAGLGKGFSATPVEKAAQARKQEGA